MLDAVYSCRFGTFCLNSDRERQQAGISEGTESFWIWAEDNSHAKGFINESYRPPRGQGETVLRPNFTTSLRVWTKYYLRYSAVGDRDPAEEERERLQMRCAELEAAWVVSDIMNEVLHRTELELQQRSFESRFESAEREWLRKSGKNTERIRELEAELANQSRLHSPGTPDSLGTATPENVSPMSGRASLLAPPSPLVPTLSTPPGPSIEARVTEATTAGSPVVNSPPDSPTWLIQNRQSDGNVVGAEEMSSSSQRSSSMSNPRRSSLRETLRSSMISNGKDTLTGQWVSKTETDSERLLEPLY